MMIIVTTKIINPGDMSESSIGLSRQEILADFRLALLSREIALLARREVLSGKAKFGIFGDGKEVVQIALARSFMPGLPMQSSSFTRSTDIQMKGLTREVPAEISIIILPVAASIRVMNESNPSLYSGIY